jgi:hypothetical protein
VISNSIQVETTAKILTTRELDGPLKMDVMAIYKGVQMAVVTGVFALGGKMSICPE